MCVSISDIGIHIYKYIYNLQPRYAYRRSHKKQIPENYNNISFRLYGRPYIEHHVLRYVHDTCEFKLEIVFMANISCKHISSHC